LSSMSDDATDPDESPHRDWITGPTVPVCFRRLAAISFHDTDIARLSRVGDEVVLHLKREAMPWAPGAVGTFRIGFQGVRHARCGYARSDVDLETVGADLDRLKGTDRPPMWLYAGVASVAGDRCIYEIETTWGVIRIDSAATTLDSGPAVALADLQELLASLRGSRISGFEAKRGLPDVWLLFRTVDDVPEESDDPDEHEEGKISLGLSTSQPVKGWSVSDP